MRFMIVGVGQTFNFETRQMDDILQVQAPDGSILSVPTTNEAAQALIKMAMNGHSSEQYGTETKAFTPETEMFRQQPAVATQAELSGRVEERFQPPEGSEDFPDGADIFGGEVSEASEEEPMGLADGSMVEPQVQQRIFQKTQQTAKSKLGLRRNPADRSGVPSMGIARVDEKGNPILPAAPDTTMIDDEEDPGEQV
jgi:hypothetical protein